MQFQNQTALDDRGLRDLFLVHTQPYDHERLLVRVRYTRSTPFSGACYYADSRIHVNLGRANRYPFTIATHVAKAQSRRPGEWVRPCYRLTVADASQLALFIYLHELFHYLVHAAGRGRQRKEAMCDRFATRVLIDALGCRLVDSNGSLPARSTWDFQDLTAFVGRAPRQAPREAAARRFIPVRIVGDNYG